MDQDIVGSSQKSYHYARDVIKGRFELGEPAIAENTEYSYYYASEVIKGRFELGEPAIAGSARYSYEYARDIIKGRFPAGEKALIISYLKSGTSYFDEYLELLESMNDPHFQVLDRLRSAVRSFPQEVLQGNKELMNFIFKTL